MFVRTAQLVFVCTVLLTNSTRADVIRLRNGGEIRGVVQSDSGGRIQVRTFAGSNIALPEDSVHFVARRSEAEELYESRRTGTADTADAQWELAEWCRLNSLKDERLWQAKETLLRDPNHSAARKLLGYIQPDEQWTTRERQHWDRGYVRSNGRWMPRQTRDTIADTPAEKEQQSAWLTRMARLSAMVDSGDTSALTELSAVRDPMALAGLTAYFRESNSIAARKAYVTALGSIRHPAMIPPLIEQAVFDRSPEIRLLAAQSVPEDEAKNATRLLSDYLRSNDNNVVQNAAAAIGEIRYDYAIESLIESLTTLHEYSTRVSTAKESELRAVDLLNKPDLTPREVFLVLQTGIVPPRGVEATTEESTGIHALYPHRNAAVLGALKRLSGEDFGLDQRTWRLWQKSRQ